jgi:hypothetical protein
VIEQTWLIGHPDPVSDGEMTGEVGSGKILETRKGLRSKK